jgi:hypothetical protein
MSVLASVAEDVVFNVELIRQCTGASHDLTCLYNKQRRSMRAAPVIEAFGEGVHRLNLDLLEPDRRPQGNTDVLVRGTVYGPHRCADPCVCHGSICGGRQQQKRWWYSIVRLLVRACGQEAARAANGQLVEEVILPLLSMDPAARPSARDLLDRPVFQGVGDEAHADLRAIIP